MFQFKQFAVDQTNCAMKINTDGVLLGAMASANNPANILDIGTGTGVIALMLAQRFTGAEIDAVEIDELAAETAKRNFDNSLFADRLKVYPQSFQAFFEDHPNKKYDLIVSNPPFYINSLASPNVNKNIAKHADEDFFKQLIIGDADILADNGLLWLVLPPQTAEMVKSLAMESGLSLTKIIKVQSFNHSEPHREMLSFERSQKALIVENLVIYEKVNKYSTSYKGLLKDFFLSF